MTAVYWAGFATDKVYNQSDFTATITDSFSTAAFEAIPTGIGWDAVDIYISGANDNKYYRQSGFSATVKDSFGGASLPIGVTVNVDQNVYGADDDENKLYKFSGFSSTILDSYVTTPVDITPSGITYCSCIFMVWVGSSADKIYIHSNFSATMLNSVAIGGVDTGPTGVSTTGSDGPDYMFTGTQADKLYRTLGATATITDSVDVSGFEANISGISWGDFAARTTGQVPVQTLMPRLTIGDIIYTPDSTFQTRELLIDMARRYSSFRGRFRVFGTAVHRFYYDTSPIDEDTAVDETNTTLDGYTSTATFGNGTHYVGATEYNGLLDSGLGDVGANSEPYRTLRISASAAASLVPYGPLDWRLEVRASGVIRIIAIYHQKDVSVTDGSSDARAGYWAIAYTTNGSTPATDTPDETQAFIGDQIEGLSYDLPGQANGTTVKVRLQTRRNDGTAGSPVWVYSGSSSVLTATADASGPSAPPGGDTWAGNIPKET